jgi:arginase
MSTTVRMRSITSVLVMRNSLGQNYSKGVELSHAEVARIIPPHTKYNLITSDAYRASTRDGAVSTLALSECEKMIRPAAPGIAHSHGNSHSVFVGGDHLTSMCSVLASLKVYGNKFKLLWMDAHADIHNEKTSPSKNKHGMVVNMLLNHKYAGIPRLHPSQVMYIGLRSTEPEEDAFIKHWKIRVVSAADIRKSEVNSYRKIADFVLNSNAHVSLDVDVLDPSEMKATATPAINGPHLDQILTIMGIVNSSARNYYATDVMEYNPRKFMGDDPASAARARDAMRAIFRFLI